MALIGTLGIDFVDLIDDDSDGLARLDEQFIDFLGAVAGRDSTLAAQLLTLRSRATSSASFDSIEIDLGDAKAHSDTLIGVAKALEKFLALLFPLEDTAAVHAENTRLLRLKWKFVKRKGVLLHPLTDLTDFDGLAAEKALAELIQVSQDEAQAHDSNGPIPDHRFAHAIENWQAHQALEPLALAAKFSAWAVQHPLGKARYKNSVLFNLPDEHSTQQWFGQLDVRAEANQVCHLEIKPIRFHARKGFDLTEVAATGNLGALQALDQADYCLKCHKTGTDSCSKGKNADGQAPHNPPILPTQPTPTGCPLRQKISEFLSLRAEGFSIGALAMIVRDNPMLAATGHRICNDCTLACVFQQQTPVDIPMAETQVLREVLSQPWGFEIYSLLTRWNPLNTRVPKPLGNTGHSILVAGMGPAGFTLAHHLLQLGHGIVGVDALKIQSLPKALSTLIAQKQPILDMNQWFEALSTRPAYGFGGVAEYGITSRWEKNFLTVIRLLLARRNRFALLGDTRLGSSLSIAGAFDAGFEHVACALGAGAPRLPSLIENALPKGVKTASDFLMALHSAGARQDLATTNLQIRMPIVVVGGGLTGVDTATEAQAYYPIQVARYARQWGSLRLAAQTQFLVNLPVADHEVHDEFLAHAAKFEANPNNIHQLMNAMGGVTLMYRKDITQSPAYTLNRDELTKALGEGIKIITGISPVGYQLDAFGAVLKLTTSHGATGEKTSELPARAVIYAIGTKPNDMILREEPRAFEPTQPRSQLRTDPGSFQLAIRPDGRWVSRLGDLHPLYAGSVVKAMASAKAAAPLIDASFKAAKPRHVFKQLVENLQSALTATVTKVVHHAPGIAEIYLHAPAAANAFAPGQFFRLQSLEDDSIEPLAMTGASVDPATGILSMVVLASGTSSLRSMRLKAGQRVSLMGPTGQPSDLPHNKKVVLVGGGLGNAVLFSIGKAMRDQGCEVVYFAGYRKAADLFTPERIEQAGDTIVWCCEEVQLPARRPNDHSHLGNILQALEKHQTLIANADHLLTIGSDRMMAAVAHARKTHLAPSLGKIPLAIGSINSPMQCMMKAICGQCLQTHRHPVTGELSYVFSCQQQDQLLDCVDFPALAARLNQNNLQEQLSKIIELQRP
jgi:NADPH-dependent glutamate synthase beta subunit-like oxidoreductase/NAD(P)H-flavin reductase